MGFSYSSIVAFILVAALVVTLLKTINDIIFRKSKHENDSSWSFRATFYSKVWCMAWFIVILFCGIWNELISYILLGIFLIVNLFQMYYYTKLHMCPESSDGIDFCSLIVPRISFEIISIELLLFRFLVFLVNNPA